jgi:hypothetical protein
MLGPECQKEAAVLSQETACGVLVTFYFIVAVWEFELRASSLVGRPLPVKPCSQSFCGCPLAW